MRFSLLVVAAVLLIAPVASAQTTDYTKTEGLSEPQYETVRDVLRVPAYDGRELYLEVTRPKAAGRFPVILEASPYHGTLADRDGTRILPEPRDADGKSLGLTRYFGPRGYDVLTYDGRAHGESGGNACTYGVYEKHDLLAALDAVGVTRAETEKLIADMRRIIPDLAIRTTFITGFPGETEEQVDELAQFIAEQKFERVGVFTYSLEEGTPAVNLDEHLPE
jgi:hypothetical protein